jgi:hypothetical protein
MKKRKLNSDGKDGKEEKKSEKNLVKIITKKSQEKEYQRVLSLEEVDDNSSSLSTLKTFCVERKDSGDSYGNSQEYYTARDVETVERFFLKTWFLMNEEEEENPMYDNIDYFPESLVQKILKAYSLIEPIGVNKIKKIKHSEVSIPDLYGRTFNLRHAKFCQWLAKRCWKKVPYWLIEELINFFETECAVNHSANYTIYQCDVKPLNVLAERRSCARKILTKFLKNKDLVQIILR